LIAVGIDPGPRINDLHTGPWLETFREVVRERDARMRRVTVPREDDKAGRLRLHLLPRHAVDLRGGKRLLQIARERVERWR
jgi:hypothetical protein